MLSGCAEGKIGDPAKPTPTVTTTQMPKIKTISYKLPSEWRMTPDLEGFIDNPPADIPLSPNAKFIKFEFTGGDQGGESEAKEKAQNFSENTKAEFSQDPQTQVIYTEKTLAGYRLYVIEYYADSYPGGYHWNTQFYFVKNGEVWGAIIYSDRFDHQVKTIEKFLQTFKVEYE